MNKKKIILFGMLGILIWMIYWETFQKNQFKLSGSLEMTEHSLGSPVPGRLEKIVVKDGSRVKNGDILGVLDRYDQAKRDYERLNKLYQAGGSDKQSLEHAELLMKDQMIVAPVDGVVLLKVREAGEVVPAGSTVVLVGDDSEMWVRVYVPENFISKVRLDQKAELVFDGLKKKYKGHVSFIASKAEFTPRNVQTEEERVTQTFAVKVMLDEKDEFLRPGIFADVKIDFKH